MLDGVGSSMQTDATTPNKELLVLQMLDGVGSCVQTDATTRNYVRTCSVHYGKDTTHKTL